MYNSIPDNLFTDEWVNVGLKTSGCFADMCRCMFPVLPPLQACRFSEHRRQRAEPSISSKWLQIQLRLRPAEGSSLVSLSALSSATSPRLATFVSSSSLKCSGILKISHFFASRSVLPHWCHQCVFVMLQAFLCLISIDHTCNPNQPAQHACEKERISDMSISFSMSNLIPGGPI